MESNLRKSMKEFKVFGDRLLGEGATGLTYYAENQEKRSFAVKVVSTAPSNKTKMHEELAILQQLTHRNLITFYGYDYISDEMGLLDKYFLIMELAETNLKNFLSNSDTKTYFENPDNIRNLIL